MALQQEFEQQGNWLFKYRGQLPVVILVVQLVLYYLQAHDNQLPTDDAVMPASAAFQWNLICLAVVLIGQFVRCMVIGYTPRNTSGRNTKKQVADVVNSTGIYSVVRHPLYLGNFFMWLGVAMISQNIAFVAIFVLVFWLFYERIMYAEEQFLTRTHGDAYSSWASSVPAFIPSLSGWKPSPRDFSLRNVLKRESVGFLNIFICFYLTSLTASFARGTGFQKSDPWLLMLIVSGVITAVIYILRKWTKVLIVEGR